MSFSEIVLKNNTNAFSTDGITSEISLRNKDGKLYLVDSTGPQDMSPELPVSTQIVKADAGKLIKVSQPQESGRLALLLTGDSDADLSGTFNSEEVTQFGAGVLSVPGNHFSQAKRMIVPANFSSGITINNFSKIKNIWGTSKVFTILYEGWFCPVSVWGYFNMLTIYNSGDSAEFSLGSRNFGSDGESGMSYDPGDVRIGGVDWRGIHPNDQQQMIIVGEYNGSSYTLTYYYNNANVGSATISEPSLYKLVLFPNAPIAYCSCLVVWAGWRPTETSGTISPITSLPGASSPASLYEFTEIKEADIPTKQTVTTPPNEKQYIPAFNENSDRITIQVGELYQNINELIIDPSLLITDNNTPAYIKATAPTALLGTTFEQSDWMALEGYSNVSGMELSGPTGSSLKTDPTGNSEHTYCLFGHMMNFFKQFSDPITSPYIEFDIYNAADPEYPDYADAIQFIIADTSSSVFTTTDYGDGWVVTSRGGYNVFFELRFENNAIKYRNGGSYNSWSGSVYSDLAVNTWHHIKLCDFNGVSNTFTMYVNSSEAITVNCYNVNQIPKFICFLIGTNYAYGSYIDNINLYKNNKKPILSITKESV